MADKNLPPDPWADLARFGWLTPVRQQIEHVVMSYEQAQRDSTRFVAPVGLHMLLVAPPGLGRFRLAIALASMLFDRGHVRGRNARATFGKDLVSRWIGLTRRATLETCESALNGTLVIPYASGLAGHDFSQEAVDTLIEFMDANKECAVIVMIFEPRELPEFAAVYPELVSRFHGIDFPIPGLNEQFEFLHELAKDHNCLLPDDLESLLGPWIERRMRENRWEYMRQIGDLLGRAIRAGAERESAPHGLAVPGQIREGSTLERVDFDTAMQELDGISPGRARP